MSLEFDKLIQPAKDGDAQALGQLSAIYRHYVEFIARPQIKGRLYQKVSASDVAQETFGIISQSRLAHYIRHAVSDATRRVLSWFSGDWNLPGNRLAS